jgi:hypothetical protein
MESFYCMFATPISDGVKMTRPPLPAAGAISWIIVNTHPYKERFAVENLKNLPDYPDTSAILPRKPDIRALAAG